MKIGFTMKRKLAIQAVALISMLGFFLGYVSPNGALLARTPDSDSPIDALVRDLCDKSVALLGEEANHGNAKTTQFKVQLIRRLVDECHYDAFFLEAGTYDFLNIQNKLIAGEPVTEDMLKSAIGRMWSSQEMAPLIPFLFQKVKSDSIVLGGIDDQVGATKYVQNHLADDLTSSLPGERQEICRREIQKYAAWLYTETDPYSLSSVNSILSCAREIKSTLLRSSSMDSPLTRNRLQMVRNLERFFMREKASLAASGGGGSADADRKDYNERDQSMYKNFVWLSSQPKPPKPPKPPKKVIIWTATVHAAKGLSSVQGNVVGIIPFGSYVHKAFGERSFVLGFSALSGSYTTGVFPPSHVIPHAPAGSLEALAFINATVDVRYLDTGQLASLGPVSGHPINYTSMSARWDSVMDGLVVFREENPPHAVNY